MLGKNGLQGLLHGLLEMEADDVIGLILGRNQDLSGAEVLAGLLKGRSLATSRCSGVDKNSALAKCSLHHRAGDLCPAAS